ncbi:MATE family efflux transporter [Pseudoramibacter porci]|uniref:Multidrug export protein MepA n=1 Tax=Pseudoramibacter porci TaxID=2606631 RepID=A0A7X2NFA3_9FIRM|nr:MATE family efflux transporter [Pseudoramibacter porci]MSS19413.1 MATE family efflux transporter [Pseudoramibacter porci]
MAARQQNAQYNKMMHTPVHRLIVALAIPTIISMMISSIYNAADTYFVGRLGTSASAATGIVFGLMAVLQAVGFMCGHGSGSIVARCLGQKKPQDASVTVSTGLALVVIITLAITALGLIFVDPLMRLLGATPTILPYARIYGRCILAAAPFITASFLMNNVLRYEGRAVLGTTGLTIGALLNIAGDPFLMFKCHLGIFGAGLSTALSQIIAFGLLFYFFLSGRTTTRLSLRLVKLKAPVILEILSVGMPSLCRQGLNTVSTLLLNIAAAGWGDAAISAMSIVNRVTFMVFAVVIGIGQGLQPVAGFSYGAQAWQRLKSAFVFTVGLSTGVALALALAVGLNVKGVVSAFIGDPKVIAIAAPALVYQCAALVFTPPFTMTNMTYQSAGIAGKATFLSLLRNGLCFIPLILILPRTLGLMGVQTAQPVADALTFLIALPFTLDLFKTLNRRAAGQHTKK